MRVMNLNERTLALYFDEVIDEQLNEKIVWMKRQLERANIKDSKDSKDSKNIKGIKGIQAVQNTYHMVAVHFDPCVVDASEVEAELLKYLSKPADSVIQSRTVEIPVCYDGPDLEKVAKTGKLTVSEVIRKHSETEYHVYFLGFAAGFPYLGGLSSELITPRLEQPRVKVDSGAVGIADRQTGIYTVPSPGGWNLIGRTPLELFSPTQQPNCLIQAGDKLKFVPITSEQYDSYKLSQSNQPQKILIQNNHATDTRSENTQTDNTKEDNVTVDNIKADNIKADNTKAYNIKAVNTQKPNFCSNVESTNHPNEKNQVQLKGIKILKAGILTTIQDEGRYEGLSSGLSQSGVSDPFAYELALALVGQKKPHPVLEVTLGGFECQFKEDTTFTITGADADVYLNEVKIKRWTTYNARSGDRLKINTPLHGLRNYIAFGSKFHEQYRFMNAYATDLKSKLGGMHGRKLMDGDSIYFAKKTDIVDAPEYKTTFDITTEDKPASDKTGWRKGSINQSLFETSHYFENLTRTTKKVRLHTGPQQDRLTQLEWQTFLETTYIVSPKSDRMGIRLEGSTFRPTGKMDILTDVIAFGAIQLTQDGTPIILMSERQTTGGYAKVANVAYDDLGILAQAKPGDQIEFVEFTNLTNNTNKTVYTNISNNLEDLIIWEDMQGVSETKKIALKYDNSSAVYHVLVERKDD